MTFPNAREFFEFLCSRTKQTVFVQLTHKHWYAMDTLKRLFQKAETSPPSHKSSTFSQELYDSYPPHAYHAPTSTHTVTFTPLRNLLTCDRCTVPNYSHVSKKITIGAIGVGERYEKTNRRE